LSCLELEVLLDVHSPGELLDQATGEDAADGDISALGPSNDDTGVDVVGLGGTQGDGLVVVLDAHLGLQLVQLGVDLGDGLGDITLPVDLGELRDLDIGALVVLEVGLVDLGLQPAHALDPSEEVLSLRVGGVVGGGELLTTLTGESGLLSFSLDLSSVLKPCFFSWKFDSLRVSSFFISNNISRISAKSGRFSGSASQQRSMRSA